MGVPVYQSYTTTGAQTPVALDYFQTPFNASVFAYIVTGAVTYAVQYTADPIDDTSVTPRWFDDANLPTGTTASGSSNYMFPVRAVRINIASNTGTIEFKVLQGLPQ
jgi:hypothetical protein